MIKVGLALFMIISLIIILAIMIYMIITNATFRLALSVITMFILIWYVWHILRESENTNLGGKLITNMVGLNKIPNQYITNLISILATSLRNT